LLGRCSTSSLFALVIFEIWSYIFPQAIQNQHNSLWRFLPPLGWQAHATIYWGKYLQTFLSRLVWNCNSPNLNLSSR
jgi:hypothetical protein